MLRFPPFLLLVLGFALLISACNKKSPDNQKVIDCLAAYRLSADEIAKVSKEIHAEKKSFSLDTLFTRKAKYQGFNGTVLIAQKGVILFEKAFGVSDVSKKDSLCMESAFQLASITKTFTAVSILLLVQDNKIKLTDSVQKFLPGFPYHGISIENLLSHRTGLPNYLYSFEDKRRANKFLPSNDSILKWFNEADSLPKPYGKPGKNFNYNNTNFIVLASIVEKVSGRSYADFLKERIFEPLGMNHTYVDTLVADSICHLKTKGHQGNRTRARDFYDGVYGDKGIYSTAGDMFKWYTALHSHCLLNKHLMKEAFSPKSFERPSRHNYGLGFRIMTDTENMKKAHYVYHGGWWAGYSTMFWTDQEADFVIIILGNKKNNAVYEIKPILEILEENMDKNIDNIDEEI